ncbi:MAG: putative serine/threonine protein kinase [Methanothermococcus sp.]|jgi:putative serine/threonine protein kinase|uniref:protein kinase n=1 Tax=Methanothermococcus TaxID=155862 RepID=UPI0003761BFA|nr:MULTISPECIES: protein kinase [Methanothermococcus]MDK2790470.1 putative serine/threonine protein kinase [Methanothermococcus sp.]MDK2987610.1 putative serine/threonine protein kinase [Methanothermococcus sp.]
MINKNSKIQIEGCDGVIANIIDWDIVEKLVKNDITPVEVIGKGHRGIVLKGFSEKYKDSNGNYIQLAIKIPRKDTPKNTIFHEGTVLEKTNKFNVGPKVYEFTNEYLLMEYVEGITLRDYIDRCNKEEILWIIEESLRQCLKLDLHSIDHTEIQGGKHIIISKHKIYIIDFDKARLKNPHNFTSAMSLFFGGGYISEKVKNILNMSEEEEKDLRKLAKLYKNCFKEK